MKYPVAKKSDFSELEPRFLRIGDVNVAVYKFRGSFYAYSSWCPHQGGPACEGIVLGGVQAQAREGSALEDSTPADDLSIACPWHGVEFDLQSGVCRADPTMRIAPYRVEADGDEIFVVR